MGNTKSLTNDINTLKATVKKINETKSEQVQGIPVKANLDEQPPLYDEIHNDMYKPITAEKMAILIQTLDNEV